MPSEQRLSEACSRGKTADPEVADIRHNVDVSLRSRLLSAAKHSGWSLGGVLVGVVSLVFAYIAVVEKRPRVAFTIVNEANVLDVHQSMQDLSITFRGEDLQNRNLNLRILTIRLENTGDVDILQGQYDQTEPWGFAITNGRLVEVRVKGSNSDYLRHAIRPALRDNVAYLAKTILERGRYVSLEALVIHSKGSDPTVHPFGKIAGIDKLEVLRARRPDDLPWWQQAWGGPALVQLVRLFSYFVALVIVLGCAVGLVALVAFTGDRVARWRRRRLVEPFQKELPPLQSAFVQLFVDRGLGALQETLVLIDQPARMKAATRYIPLGRSGARFSNEGAWIDAPNVPEDDSIGRHGNPFLAAELLDRKILLESDDGSYALSDGARSALEDVIGKLSDR